MSLVLSNTVPENLNVKTAGVGILTSRGIKQVVFFGDYEIPMDEFCAVMEYVLTNTDLEPDDPRLDLVKKVKKMNVTDGYMKMFCGGPNSKRLTYES